jgi:hypothetical protein
MIQNLIHMGLIPAEKFGKGNTIRADSLLTAQNEIVVREFIGGLHRYLRNCRLNR